MKKLMMSILLMLITPAPLFAMDIPASGLSERFATIKRDSELLRDAIWNQDLVAVRRHVPAIVHARNSFSFFEWFWPSLKFNPEECSIISNLFSDYNYFNLLITLNQERDEKTNPETVRALIQELTPLGNVHKYIQRALADSHDFFIPCYDKSLHHLRGYIKAGIDLEGAKKLSRFFNCNIKWSTDYGLSTTELIIDELPEQCTQEHLLLALYYADHMRSQGKACEPEQYRKIQRIVSRMHAALRQQNKISEAIIPLYISFKREDTLYQSFYQLPWLFEQKHNPNTLLEGKTALDILLEKTLRNSGGWSIPRDIREGIDCLLEANGRCVQDHSQTFQERLLDLKRAKNPEFAAICRHQTEELYYKIFPNQNPQLKEILIT